jgi:hypothetical protein
MLSTLELDYVQHLERGYCENHPDVVGGTKEQVVDRAVKQLLTALQSNGFELDGNILKRGDGWLQYDEGTSKWQYSNNAGSTWEDMGSGSGNSKLSIHSQEAPVQIQTSEMMGDLHYLEANCTLPALSGVDDGLYFRIYGESGYTLTPDAADIFMWPGIGEGSSGQALQVGTSSPGTCMIIASSYGWVVFSVLGDVSLST